MKIAYATTANAKNINFWSGTPYHMSRAFQHAGHEVDYIGDLKRKRHPLFKLTQVWKKWTSGQRECPNFNKYIAQHYSLAAEAKLKLINPDVIIAPLINPICYLHSAKPIILWTDALYSALLGFNWNFNNHSATTIADGNANTLACLERATLAVFSSDWAARSAIELYGINPDKVKVVPYGANFENPPSFTEVTKFIHHKSTTTLKLLFVGKHWFRKGGDIVLKVAAALHASGQKVELHLVGCQPPIDSPLPSYITCHGFISKKTLAGQQKLLHLFQSSHFLFMPSRSDAYGIVFCEANAYGLPALTSTVGGISTVVKNNINGMTFSLDTPVEIYCHYLISLMQNYQIYKELSFSSYNEFQTRLNWKVAVNTVTDFIK